jgi:DNA-binding CsgD family transcriptional regulator
MLSSTAVNDYMFDTEYFNQQPQHFCRFEQSIDLWPNDSEDAALNFCKLQGLYNGLSFAKELDGSLEVVCFMNNDGSPAIQEFYRNHHAVLQKFIDHFRQFGGDLTNPDGPAKLGISPHMRRDYPQIDKIFKNTTPWERKIIEFNISLNSVVQDELTETRKRLSISTRELECLSHLTTGKTSKEIARELNLSPRTVDSYLNNIRNKTGCITKRELTQWFEHHFRLFLTKPGWLASSCKECQLREPPSFM